MADRTRRERPAAWLPFRTTLVIAIWFILVVLLPSSAQIAHSEQRELLFREDFDDLKNWKPLYFPGIRQHTLYTIESETTTRCLRAESNASASALVNMKEFNVYEYPIMAWRWKVENVYKTGNAKTKKGDDYPLRIYLIFQETQEKAGLWSRLKNKSASMVFGQPLPHSTLSYIWANRPHEEQIITNSFTDRVKMVLLHEGTAGIGEWHTEEVDIIHDYERAFGEKPPATACIAIMNDSDNTGEQSISYVDYIEVFRKQHERRFWTDPTAEVTTRGTASSSTDAPDKRASRTDQRH